MLVGCTLSQKDDNLTAVNTSPANTANRATNTVKDNTEELRALVNLPFDPEETVWKEESLKDQTSDQIEKKLIAVLRLPAEQAKAFLTEVQKRKQGETANMTTEQWFPAELMAQSEISGDDLLNGESYSADDILLPPYIHGRLVKIENSDYFILEASSK